VDVELEELSPERGFGLRVAPFEVAAGQEIQDCYFVVVPDLGTGSEPIWIDRIVVAANPGTHHNNVFRVRTILGLDGAPDEAVKGGECWKSANWADWPFVVNSQESSPDDPTVDWTLPEGVAHRFTPGEKLMVQTHYVNATTQTTP
jgi:hypothetical protein